MEDVRAQRTLVKSPPELWAEISDVETLARHLGEFGDIRITRVDPETTVAWEGDRIRGTVSLEPSGWGTRVTLAAELLQVTAPEPQVAEPAPAPQEPAPVVEPEPEPVAEAEPMMAAEPDAEAKPERAGWFARLFRRRRRSAPAVEPDPPAEAEPEPVAEEPVPEPEPEPDPVAAAPEPEPVAAPQPAPLDAAAAEGVLVAVLDDLGAAHHRPFSRMG